MGGDSKLEGAREIAEYLGISERHFFYLKKKYENTPHGLSYLSRPEGKFGRVIWTERYFAFSWGMQLKALGERVFCTHHETHRNKERGLPVTST